MITSDQVVFCSLLYSCSNDHYMWCGVVIELQCLRAIHILAEC